MAAQGRSGRGGVVHRGRGLRVLADGARPRRSAAIRGYWRTATAPHEELELSFGAPLVDGDRVAVEWWAVMRDPEWRPDAPSEVVTRPGCLLLRFTAEGLCAELREYYNPVFGIAHAPQPGWGR